MSEEKVSIQLMVGRWRERGGGVATVEDRCTYNSDYQWTGRGSDGLLTDWRQNGLWLRTGQPSKYDLIEYLGPLEEGAKK